MSVRAAPACIDWPLPLGDYRSWSSPMKTWQNGRCAFCGEPDRLVRDHDHDSSLIRGLLCMRCNSAEPYEWWDTAWDMYRDDCNPAAILGIQEVYAPYTLTILAQAIMQSQAADADYQRNLAWAML